MMDHVLLCSNKALRKHDRGAAFPLLFQENIQARDKVNYSGVYYTRGMVSLNSDGSRRVLASFIADMSAHEWNDIWVQKATAHWRFKGPQYATNVKNVAAFAVPCFIVLLSTTNLNTLN